MARKKFHTERIIIPAPEGTAKSIDAVKGKLSRSEFIRRAILPQTRRIGVLWNPTTPSHSRALPAVETAGEKLALELRMVPARGLDDFDSACATMAQERVGGFLAVGSPVVVGQRVPLAALALKHRLPGMFPI